MKIVVNRCYGGFGLSTEAEKLYLKYIGKECFFYKQIEYRYKDGKDKYIRVDKGDRGLLVYTVTEDLGETTDDIGGHNDSKHPDVYWYSGNLERNDPILVRVVEELGSDKASGTCSKLEVVEIPDGVQWVIEEYDGMERVAEAHRSW